MENEFWWCYSNCLALLTFSSEKQKNKSNLFISFLPSLSPPPHSLSSFFFFILLSYIFKCLICAKTVLGPGEKDEHSLSSLILSLPLFSSFLSSFFILLSYTFKWLICARTVTGSSESDEHSLCLQITYSTVLKMDK